MKTYDPQISVKLIKAIKRSELVRSIPVAANRYGIDGIDLTPYLGDGSAIRTVKSVRHPSVLNRDNISLYQLLVGASDVPVFNEWYEAQGVV